MTHELLAQLIEVTSVGATSGHRYKKPLEVPRPKHVRRRRRANGARSGITDAADRQEREAAEPPPRGDVVSFSDEAMKRGINVLASSTRGVRG